MFKYTKSVRIKNRKVKEKYKSVMKSGKNNFVVTPLKNQLEIKFRNNSSLDEGCNVLDINKNKSEASNCKLENFTESRKSKKRRKLLRRNSVQHENVNVSGVTSTDPDEYVERSVSLHRDIIRQKLVSKRLEKGLVMLSPKIEAKIYKLKKALHKKGVSEKEIKQIIRQKRRSEEIKQRGPFGKSLDVCFRCRKPGHRFAECRLVTQDTDQGAGVCFSCGSTEHILKNCPNKKRKADLPFAKCFVCGKQGHLSGQCPSNPKGAFPKGGKCNVCGSINHLKRDCPHLQETVETDIKMKANTSHGTSADALDDDL